jgi:hypothetical protein
VRNWKSTILGLLAVFGIGCLLYAANPAEKERQGPVRINAEDLCHGEYVIIGRLGKQYGEIVKIRGIWKGSDGFYDLFHITHIEGKEVADTNPLTFISANVRQLRKSKDGYTVRATRDFPIPKEGTVYEGRVYESGGYPYDVQPPAAETILNLPITQHLTYGFRSRLFLIDEAK